MANNNDQQNQKNHRIVTPENILSIATPNADGTYFLHGSLGANKKNIEIEKYVVQKQIWPKMGRFIFGQYDDESIIVYQAFNHKIASYAVENQKFEGCPFYNPNRMTWIKTNFLWMMYRSGWGEKDANQARTLAIWLRRSAFERILSQALVAGHPDNKKKDSKAYVRLQWDPDHSPGGAKHPFRRAIQLGLKGITTFANGEDIVEIQDISDYVEIQRKLGHDDLWTPRERVYPIDDPSIIQRIKLSTSEEEPPEEEEENYPETNEE